MPVFSAAINGGIRLMDPIIKKLYRTTDVGRFNISILKFFDGYSTFLWYITLERIFRYIRIITPLWLGDYLF